MRQVYIETLGCAKNRVDSEIIAGTLLGNGFSLSESPELAEIIIVNTCGFLASAVDESIERILALAELKKSAKCKMLVAAGCMIERYKEPLMEEVPELDALIGTSDYTKIIVSINNFFEDYKRTTYLAKNPLYSSKNYEANRVLSTKGYAYLKIAEGCSNMCSFCNIPKLRGRQISRSMSSITDEFKKLIGAGIKEINLISQDSSSYGYDLSEDCRLITLVRSLLDDIDNEFWLRIFYTYPNRYPLELIDLMNQDSRLVPYIDFPLQHISDTVLKEMNRKITRSELERKIFSILGKNPEIALRTTLIVGFPNESDKDFMELLKFIEEGYFQHLGVFLYSHEDNIRSYGFGDTVSEVVKKDRYDQLMAAQQTVSLEKSRRMIGQIQKVLVEGRYEETDLLIKGRNKFQGVEVDGLVLINDGDANAGDFNQVEITEAHPYDLIGKVI
ncbi:30S ribosomal protein S12 methylthiotransferase RimO [bacterium]|nr:30S ribosomal protein S12 methylthiotransferase RimO [bacterium]